MTLSCRDMAWTSSLWLCCPFSSLLLLERSSSACSALDSCRNQRTLSGVRSLRTHTHTHTHICLFLWKVGTSIGVMVLYKLYVLLPYTYPTPKLSPHRKLCISTFPPKILLCMIYKHFESGDMGQCPHMSPSPCDAYVLPISLYKCMSSFVTKKHTHTHTHTHTQYRAAHLGNIFRNHW